MKSFQYTKFLYHESIFYSYGPTPLNYSINICFAHNRPGAVEKPGIPEGTAHGPFFGEA